MNICCVGDDDQSIYSWRGAEIKNFLEFDQVYKKSKVIRKSDIVHLKIFYLLPLTLLPTIKTELEKL